MDRLKWTLVFGIAFHASLSFAQRATSPDIPPGTARPPELTATRWTAPAVYATQLGDTHFDRKESFLHDGYLVEGGNLVRGSAVAGSMAVVRAPNGTVTAIIDRPGKRGLLRVDHGDKGSFTEDTPVQDHDSDIAPELTKSPAVSGKYSPNETYTVDVFTGFTRSAIRRIEDPVAYSLAQLEMVNIALSNSLVGNIKLNLAGMKFVDTDYSVNRDSWNQKVDQQFQGPRSSASADIVAVFVWGNEDGASNWYNGLGSMGGKTSLQTTNSVTTFRHEVGHNSGSDHCNDGTQAGYAWGYQSSVVCGDREPHYSSPLIKQANGSPAGIVDKADSARVWKENAVRLSSYEPTLPGDRMILAGDQATTIATLTIQRPDGMSSGLVALDPSIGPIALTLSGSPGYTTLNVPLEREATGEVHAVKIRAAASRGGCARYPMNYANRCSSGPNLFVTLTHVREDNPGLPPGAYNGMLKLKALDIYETGWTRPVTVSVALFQ